MAENLPFQVEYAKSGRAKCKGCKETIVQGKLRIAVMVQSAFFDGKQANWYHEECFFMKQRPKAISEISQLHSLRQPDRERVIAAVESTGTGVVLPIEKGKGKKSKKRVNDEAAASIASLKDFRTEYSKSSRANCIVCEMKIIKGEVRICKIVFDTEVGMKFGGQPLWHHVQCFANDRSNLMFWAGGEHLPGFGTLSKDDQAMVKKELPSLKATEVPVKKLKAEKKDPEDIKKEQDDKDKFDVQNKLFFKYRDSLKKNLSKKDYIYLLEANGQEVPPGEDRCLDRLTDCIAFGALLPCKVCKNGQLVLETHTYICTGDISEWTKCSATTRAPERVLFKVPKKYKTDVPTFKRYKPKIIERIFLVDTPVQNIVKLETETKPKTGKPPPPLKNLDFFIHKSTGKKDEVKNKILKLGGNVSSSIHINLAAVVSTEEELEKMNSKMKQVQSNDIQVVTADFFDLIKKDSGTIPESLQLIIEKNIATWGSDPAKRVPQDVIDGKSIIKSKSLYKSGKSSKKMLKLKDGSAVDPDSQLDDKTHVYKDGVSWSVVLGLTDIVSGKNSFYKMQLLESDVGRKYWVFRSWGRIGTTIGGSKTDSCKSLDAAVKLFEEMYMDKTQNPWMPHDNWKFQKVPGKMYPIDVDYGDAEGDNVKLKNTDVTDSAECKLDPTVQDLVKMIFDLNQMKKVLLEFELDTEKMPLGKLSRKQITAGYTVLNELLSVIEKGISTSSAKIIDFTNRFFTLIPHDFGIKNAPLLDNIEAIKTKTSMLDNLLELEIAYSLLKSGGGLEGCHIEANYIKLKTEIVPLSVGSPEYELLHKYVKNTHAKTHAQYDLEVLQVFKVVREGEEKRFKPFRKIDHRRLLWHGSRVTNFAGILSQGLRIAPPEAPAQGYMFGKGIYFADMVSKSANYCCTSKSNPVGVLLLCEVALGKMKQCHNAEFVTKLPSGTHSVMGVGRTEPDPNMNHILDDGVIVPLGTPINKRITTSLLYNEYIVYDVAQVNVKYLFQMKFNWKF